jgi:hypothetical protein
MEGHGYLAMEPIETSKYKESPSTTTNQFDEFPHHEWLAMPVMLNHSRLREDQRQIPSPPLSLGELTSPYIKFTE